jgi:hypothetical protein
MNRTLAHPGRMTAVVASPIFLLSAYVTWLVVPDVVRVVVTEVVRTVAERLF